MYQQEVQVWYLDHHGWLYAWLRKKLGCPHHAADVAQNTFLRLLTGRNELDQIQQPRAWLTTTAQRLIVDEFRRAKIEQAYMEELALHVADRAGFPSPEQILVAVETLTQLSAVLDAAATKARAAFIRHYLDGLTQAAVAEELGVSSKMVQKYLVQVLLQISQLDIKP